MSQRAPRVTQMQRRPRLAVSLAQAIEHYLTALKLEGKSAQTIVWYARRLGEFQRFVDGRPADQDVAVLSLPDGQDYIHALLSRKVMYGQHPNRQPVPRGLALTTVNGSARAIRAFASWLAEAGYTQENVFKPLRPPKPPRQVIQPLTVDEVRQLLGAIRQHTPEGARNYGVLLLFLDCGLRISELVNLKLADVDFAGGEVKVLGKGNKERIVPVGLVTRRALIRYRDQCRPEPATPHETAFFLTVAGYPISIDSVEKLLQRLARRTGIERLHPHLLRHTAAVMFIRNGGDAFSLQRLLGHESLEVTRRYVQLAESDVKAKHRLFSPIDNLDAETPRRGRPRGRHSAT